jgi:hypothetical protein
MIPLTHALSLLAAVFLLSVGCCSGQELCGGDYDVSYLDTVQSESDGDLGIFLLPTGYTNAYINFCNPTEECPGGAYACITGSGVATVTLCETAPTVVGYIDDTAPTLGIQFACSSIDTATPLNGIISSVRSPPFTAHVCCVLCKGTHLSTLYVRYSLLWQLWPRLERGWVRCSLHLSQRWRSRCILRLRRSRFRVLHWGGILDWRGGWGVRSQGHLVGP